MATTPIHVTVTGAAGQIGYQLLFRIASGQLLGADQPVVLRLLEIEPGMKALEGVVMELDDCAFPLLAGVEMTTDLDVAFDGTSWALLVGSVPRKAGMERGDLLNVNGGIFKPQGQAINANATIAGTPVPQAIGDQAWLEGPFIETVQKRGAAIIEARGASSAASAANAAIDTVVSLRTATPAGDCASVAVSSNGEYGVPEGLMFGYPIIADGSGSWSVAEGVEHDDFAKARIATTLNELIEERDAVKDLGLIG